MEAQSTNNEDVYLEKSIESPTLEIATLEIATFMNIVNLLISKFRITTYAFRKIFSIALPLASSSTNLSK